MIDHYGTRIRLKFNGSCLKQPNKLTYGYEHKVNVYIIYELGASSTNDSDSTLKNCLFGAVTLAKNADMEKYGYSGFGIGFDRRSRVSFPGGGFGQNVLIFGVEMSASAHIDNKKKHILVLGKGPTQGLEHTLTAEKCILLILMLRIKTFCWENSFLFVNGAKIHKFKVKDSKHFVGQYVLETFQEIDW